MVAFHVPNVYHYFQRACQREHDFTRGAAGDKVIDEDGNSVVFRIDCSGGTVRSAEYKCTTCFTLVAFCEHLREMLPGMSVAAAADVSPDDLLGLHPEVPEMRRDRATLAVAGLRAALRKVASKEGAYV